MPGAKNKLVTFEVDPATKAVKCLRCGKDLTEATRVLGDESACLGFHIYTHLQEDMKRLPMYYCQNLSIMLKLLSKSKFC